MGYIYNDMFNLLTSFFDMNKVSINMLDDNLCDIYLHKDDGDKIPLSPDMVAVLASFRDVNTIHAKVSFMEDLKSKFPKYSFSFVSDNAFKAIHLINSVLDTSYAFYNSSNTNSCGIRIKLDNDSIIILKNKIAEKIFRLDITTDEAVKVSMRELSALLSTSYATLKNRVLYKTHIVSSKNVTLKDFEYIYGEPFRGIFKSHTLFCYESKNLYGIRYPKKTSKQKKIRYFLLDQELSDSISKLHVRNERFFRVLEQLKSVVPDFNSVISNNIYISEFCFKYVDGDIVEYKTFKYISDIVENWNTILCKNFFSVSPTDVRVNNLPIKYDLLIDFIKSKNDTTFVDKFISAYPNLEKQIPFRGDCEFKNNVFKEIDTFKETSIQFFNTLSEIDSDLLNFIHKHYKSFLSIPKASIKKLIGMKNNIGTFTEKPAKITQYNTTIEYKQVLSAATITGSWTKTNTSVRSELVPAKNLNRCLQEIVLYRTQINTLIEFSNQLNNIVRESVDNHFLSLLNLYPNVKKELLVHKNEIVNWVYDKFGSQLTLNNDWDIKFGDTIIFSSDSAADKNNLLKVIPTIQEIIDCSCKDKVLEYEAIAKNYSEKYSKYANCFKDEINCTIIKLISSVEKKGLTTYCNILTGSKSAKDFISEECYGKLDYLTKKQVENYILNLINNNILVNMDRKASFGWYTSVEISSNLSRELIQDLLSETHAPVVKEISYKEVRTITDDFKNCEILSHGNYKIVDFDLSAISLFAKDMSKYHKRIVTNWSFLKAYIGDLTDKQKLLMMFHKNLAKNDSIKKSYDVILS